MKHIRSILLICLCLTINIGFSAPTITLVTIPNVPMKVGSTVIATITVTDDGGTTYTLVGGSTIGSFSLSGLARTNNTTYTATFNVTDGGTDVAAGSDIPVNLILSDGASASYSTPISQNADPIDANNPASPTILGIVTGYYKVDQTFTVSGEAGATIEYSTNNGGSWTTYSGAVTLSAEGTYNVLARQTDQAGNGPTASAVITLTIDKSNPAAPTISGISAGYYNTDQTFTVSGEAGATIEYSTNNGGLWNAYSGAVTLSAEGTYNVLARQTDQAGNGPTASAVITLTIDKSNPAAPTISGISAGYYNTDQTFTVNGEVGATIEYSTNNGGLWTAYSGAVTLSAEGTYNVLARQTDQAGNGPIATASPITVTIDKTAPSAPSIDGIVAGTYNTNKTFTLSGVEAGATLEYSTNNGGAWTAYTGIVTLSADGTYNILARQTDAAGNGPTTTASAITVTIDKTAPAVPGAPDLYSGSDFGSSNGDNVTYDDTPRFDGTAAAGSTVKVYSSINGLLGSTTAHATTGVWSFTVPTALTEGIHAITVTASDALGNESAASTSLSVTIDKTAPTILSISTDFDPTNTKPIPVDISFSENVYGFTYNDIDVSGTSGTITVPSADFSGGPKDYIFKISISNAAKTDITVKINAAKCQDLAGNDNIALSPDFTVTYDNDRPKILTITTTKTNPTNASTIDIKITFDENVTGFDQADLVLTNCTVLTFTPASAKVYNVVLTPTDGLVKVEIPEEVCIDANGLYNRTAPPFSITSDRTTPTLTFVSISSNQTHTDKVKEGGVVTCSFTASESITSVVASIAGTSATVTNVSGNNYTATITMPNKTDGPVLFSISYNDLAGNVGASVSTTTNSSSVTYDETLPTLSSVTISSNNANTAKAKVGDIVTLNFTANESIEDVIVKFYGTKIPIVTNVSGNVWKAEYTLTSLDNTGNVTFTIDFKDFASNLGGQVSSASNAVVFDKTLPTLTSVNVFSNNTDPSYAKEGNLITLQFTASETIKTPVVTINGIAATSITNPSGNNWIATRTVGASENQGLMPFSITFNDESDNSNIVTASTNGSKIIVDLTPPSITSTTVPSGVYTSGSLIIVTIQTDGKFYTGSPVSVNNVSLPLLNLNDNSYKIYYTVQPSNANHNAVASLPVDIKIKDQAGNETQINNATVQSGTLTIDTKPTYQISAPTNSRCELSTTVPVTYTFTGVQPFLFTYTYEIEGVVNEVTPPLHYSNTYTVPANKGEFRLKSLSDATPHAGIIDPDKFVVITEKPLPVITFLNSSLAYSTSDPRVLLTNEVKPTPTGGQFTGDGVVKVGVDYYFYPSIVTEESSIVTYDVAVDGCSSSKTFTINLSNSGYFAGLNGFYCKDASASTSVIIEPKGITTNTSAQSFVLSPTSPYAHTVDVTHFEINPRQMKAGIYSLKYLFKNEDNGSNSEIERSFTIDSVGTLVNFKTTIIADPLLKTEYCANDPEITLVAENLYPSNGTGHFSGPATGFIATNNTATITPSTINPKDLDFTISYYYQSENGCRSTTIPKTTKIKSLPAVSFTLRDNYNYDEQPVDLIGNEPTGEFEGSIIEANKKTLNPKQASSFGVLIPVTYSYLNTSTGCSNSTKAFTRIYKATDPINYMNGASKEELPMVHCWAETLDLNITCEPNIGSGPISGVFSSLKGAITQSTSPSNTAIYSIPKAAIKDGIDILKFKYFINSTPYEIVKRIEIDSIGPLTMDLESDICANDKPVLILGKHRSILGSNLYKYKGGTQDAFYSDATSATLYPEEELKGIGPFSVTYIFTTTRGNCSDSITKQVSINPVPIADFDVVAECPKVNSTVTFVNKTILDANWHWDLGESESFAKDTSYNFRIASVKNISLTATSDKGCKTTKIKQIAIGIGLTADFSWNGECLSNDSIKFTAIKNIGDIKSARWILDGVTTDNLSKKDSIRYLFSNTGIHELKLVISTEEGCKDSISKKLSIQPFIKFNELPKVYYNDFEGTDDKWFARSETFLEPKWERSNPTGDIFSSGPLTNAWFTNIGLANQSEERSYVLSPCFDFTNLEQPMIKLSIWSAPEPGRDGAVLQYSLDGGQTWKTGVSDNNVGESGKGVNWYDPGNISSKPADQNFGWSSLDAVTSWKTARYSLDNLKGEPNVKFRIYYANEGRNIKPFNGFAFDSVWIGERQQKVLTEYFTNSTITSSTAVNSYINTYEVNNTKDVIPIHYHTGTPSGDDLYNAYTPGPSSRGFYYGVGEVPFVFANGNAVSNISNATKRTAFEEKVDELTLYDAKIIFDTLYTNNGDVVAELRSTQNLSGQNLVLYCALVKNSIDVNGTTYYNVLRRFMPNPAGVLLPSGTWDAGTVLTQKVTLNIDNPQEYVNAKLVVFIQNSSTNKILQVASTPTSLATNNKPMDLSNLVDVYPNPARDYLIVECEHSIDRLMVLDLAGRVVGSYIPAQTRYSLPVQNLQGGVYILKGSTKNGEFVRKFVKQ